MKKIAEWYNGLSMEQTLFLLATSMFISFGIAGFIIVRFITKILEK